ncbi:MAG: MarR family transcriptional regulator [Spirochaetaceae bacterium]|nr:MarR family transcriptional regulator [Spirochaetaceae bacterium]
MKSNNNDTALAKTVDSVMETLPAVWDCIRSNLRSAATKKFGISLEQFHTLRHIRHGCSSVKDLAETRQISRPAISQAVEVLVQKGLVTRTRETEDRRCVKLALTPYARRVLDENFEENCAWMAERMANLDGEQLGIVQKAMEILKTTFLPESGRGSSPGTTPAAAPKAGASR